MVEEQEGSGDATTAKLNGATHVAAMEAQQQDDEAGFKQSVEALLKCPVCDETVSDPRQLNCGHFLCSECVTLIRVERKVRCPKCSVVTTITEEGLRVDELAASLVTLLQEYGPRGRGAKNGQDPTVTQVVNGIPYMDEDETASDADIDVAPPVKADADTAPIVNENIDEAPIINADMDSTPVVNADTNPMPIEHTDEHTDTNPAPLINIDTDAAPIANTDADPTPIVNTDTIPPLNTNPDPAPIINRDTDPAPIINTDTDPAPTVNTDTDPALITNTDTTPPPNTNPDPAPIINTDTVSAQVINAEVDPAPQVNGDTDPVPTVKADIDTTTVHADIHTPPSVDAPTTTADEEAHKPEVKDVGQIDSDVAPAADVIIDPPENYQSLDEVNEDGHEDMLPLPPPPITMTDEAAREPVEHDVTRTEGKVENTDKPASQVNEEPVEDETDSRMKPSEIKPSDVAISIEMERQCEDCHSSKCTCNVSLLTPPVSNGSQLSVETNTSNNPSEYGEMEILVKPLARFPVTESASHIEVANRNRIYTTRWTYNENGAVCTFDGNGKKLKFVHSGHHNYSGITLSKLGFIFALNTSKKRVEEFGGVDGKKVKQIKLDMCRDPQSVDIMPSGEILVVDQEKHRIIVYPHSKKGGIKPRVITNELLREPYDIATCEEGFYITGGRTRTLLKMDLDGNIIWKYNERDGKKNAKLLQGVCTDDAGDVYVVDRDNDAILVLTSDGDVKGHIKVREKSFKNQRPWYVSIRDGIMAVLFSHNLVRTYQFD